MVRVAFSVFVKVLQYLISLMAGLVLTIGMIVVVVTYLVPSALYNKGKPIVTICTERLP